MFHQSLARTRNTRGLIRLVAMIGITVVAAGCQNVANPEGPAFGTSAGSAVVTGAADNVPWSQLIAEGKAYYEGGAYGNAQAAYQKAVELNPHSPEAWLGLAASYDRLRRFDQSRFAYGRLKTLLGPTAAYYNNVGFSNLLQGELVAAYQNFQKALQQEPDNVVAQNNMQMLTHYAEGARNGSTFVD